MRKLESIKKGADLECDLLDVIKHAHGDSALRGLSSQVVYGVALKIENLFSARLSDPASQGAGSRIKIDPLGGASLAVQHWRARLPQYIEAGIEATADDVDVAYACDKSWVGGLPLTNTTFLTSKGAAIVGIPLVLPTEYNCSL